MSANAQTNAQTKFLSYSGSLVSAPLQPTRPIPYSPQQTASGSGAGFVNFNSYQKGRLYTSNPASAQVGALSQTNDLYTNGFGGYKGYQTQKDTEASAMATASSSRLYQPSIINNYPNGNIYSMANSGNRADLLAPKSSIYFPNSNSYQYSPLNNGHPSVMQVLPTPDVNPSIHSRPAYTPTPLHTGSKWDTSK